MQVKVFLEHSAILLTFIKLPFVIKIFVLTIFEWPLKTGFTVCLNDFFFSSNTYVVCDQENSHPKPILSQ